MEFPGKSSRTSSHVEIRQLAVLIIVAAAGLVAYSSWQIDKGLSLSDGGFLWYGAQRVMLGEVPMRDFFAYDIGRYYWLAAFMRVLNDGGIFALRVGLNIFQMLALLLGLVTMVRSCKSQSGAFWLIALSTVVVWMTPQFRLIDLSLPLILISALAFLIERPSLRRYFLAGAVLGIVAVFGRNHGLYGLAGTVCVILYLKSDVPGRPTFKSALLVWALGLVVGYLPVLVFIALVYGYASAFWDSVSALMRYQTTNLPLPVPWPWTVNFEVVPPLEAARSVLTGVFFLADIAIGVFGMMWLVVKRYRNQHVPPVLVAAIVLVLPYAHYAYSRADIEHLALGVPPLLIAIFAFLTVAPVKMKWPFAVLLCSASMFVMLPAHPGWICYTHGECVQINVTGTQLKVDRDTAAVLRGITRLAERYSPGERSFLVEPFWPGAYAALRRKSPMWEIYVSPFLRGAEFQRSEIERIRYANPGFVVINDLPLDGRDEMRFSNSHRLIEQYIRENFVLISDPGRATLMEIYVNPAAIN
ncbi:MAG: hypothetical protein WA632_09410 [Gallionella sp.]